MSEVARQRAYWRRELEAYWRDHARQATYGHADAVAEAIS